MREFWLPFLLSAAAGILSGWGVGGGTLLTVCMTLLLGAQQQHAQAVNLLFFLPTAAVSLLFHRKNALVDGTVWRQTALWGTAAALIASLIAVSVDVELLRKPFGILLLCSGAVMLGSAGKK